MGFAGERRARPPGWAEGVLLAALGVLLKKTNIRDEFELNPMPAVLTQTRLEKHHHQPPPRCSGQRDIVSQPARQPPCRESPPLTRHQ